MKTIRKTSRAGVTFLVNRRQERNESHACRENNKACAGLGEGVVECAKVNRNLSLSLRCFFWGRNSFFGEAMRDKARGHRPGVGMDPVDQDELGATQRIVEASQRKAHSHGGTEEQTHECLRECLLKSGFPNLGSKLQGTGVEGGGTGASSHHLCCAEGGR